MIYDMIFVVKFVISTTLLGLGVSRCRTRVVSRSVSVSVLHRFCIFYHISVTLLLFVRLYTYVLDGTYFRIMLVFFLF
uniref:Transmembrane protein n=1 Tax=Medicago truncatula TaxID=3880 RepID=I3T697_MEDTR|nr:unknown [Medicago truncatula]